MMMVVFWSDELQVRVVFLGGVEVSTDNRHVDDDVAGLKFPLIIDMLMMML
uniref:Uncharacterized protein n=1 Tax=Helianthus annuus TaxID=4232 RepID=A0A251S1P8_HELAN